MILEVEELLRLDQPDMFEARWSRNRATFLLFDQQVLQGKLYILFRGLLARGKRFVNSRHEIAQRTGGKAVQPEIYSG